MAANTKLIDGFLHQSKLVFRATIKLLKAAGWKDVPEVETTVIVHVDEILYSPKTLTDLSDMDITIKIKDIDQVQTGQQYVFFTNGWLVGEGIAVTEIGRIPATDDVVLRKVISDLIQKMEDVELQRRIVNAELVVMGNVLSTRKVQWFQSNPLTNPQLHMATIEIESIEKGQFSKKTISVLFPASTASQWIDCPKYKEGQNGIWLLQRHQKEKTALYDIPGYTALDPLDFHSKEHILTIRKMITEGW